MVRDDPDWLTFRTHESRFHLRHASSAITAAGVITDLRREWTNLPDPRAYAQCLTDIADALEKASREFRVAEMILRYEAHITMRHYELNALYTAFQSQTVLYEALQTFAREQTRQRSNRDADATSASLAWTKGLAMEALGRLLRIKTVWDQLRTTYQPKKEARMGRLIRPELQMQVQPQAQRQSLKAAGNGEGRGDADDAQHEHPVRGNASVSQPSQTERSSGADQSDVRDDRKRSREEDDGHSDHGARANSKSPRVTKDASSPAILQEDISSERPRLSEMEPLEEEKDQQKELDKAWKTVLASKQGQENLDWGKMFSNAKQLFKHTQKMYLPNDTSPEGKEALRVTINKALEPVLAWDWEEYVDKVKENADKLYDTDEWREAEQEREDALQNARYGQDPMFPPRLLQPPTPPTPEDEDEDEDEAEDEAEDEDANADKADSETDEMIAADIANGLVRVGKPPITGVWKHLTEFGQGGQGQAGLWFSVRSDDHGMVLERIVVKSIFMKNTWEDPSNWIENYFTNGESVFREKAMHAQLSSVGSASGIVEYLGSNSRQTRRFVVRLYMEYCPHGDLSTLLQNHAVSEHAAATNDQVRIPIRALWSFFNDLAKAALVMELGHDPTASEASEPPQWIEIVHRDIKPSNIFLAAPLAETGRGIPVCKLGDFGTAVPMDYEPLPNPEKMCHAGTPGWMAPEQQPFYDPAYAQELSSATNVWAIGRVMLALIELTPGWAPKGLPRVRYDDFNDGQVLRSESEPQLRALYGDELYDLIEKCLSPIPRDRISAEDLLRQTQTQVNRLFEGASPQLFDDDVLEYDNDLRWGI